LQTSRLGVRGADQLGLPVWEAAAAREGCRVRVGEQQRAVDVIVEAADRDTTGAGDPGCGMGRGPPHDRDQGLGLGLDPGDAALTMGLEQRWPARSIRSSAPAFRGLIPRRSEA